MTIGIPRSFFFYYDGNIWTKFFDSLNINYVLSPETNKEILELGNKYATDEMCLSIKNYIGHVAYLKDKCDVILVPRINNYGRMNQTCTNFLAMYDLINNIFNIKVIGYDIDFSNKKDLKKGLFKIGKIFKKGKKEIKKSYMYATIKTKKELKKKINENINKLRSNKKKVLIISHNYNTYDKFIGIPIIDLINKLDVEIIYSDLFDLNLTNKLSESISKNLYWKHCKDNIGSIKYCENDIDGIIFLSTFPCGLDSLVNELVIRKIDIPYLNLVIDDIDSLSGFETRLESFVDILNQ